MRWIGVDYGSKLAGTTVACYEDDGQVYFVQSEKKSDADAFLSELFKRLQPQQIFLDAPISLPAAYFGKGDNYFYRKCDQETRAMSPMFLGGLTARAMKLVAQFPDIDFKETYPAYLIKSVLDYSDLYPKKGPYDNRLCEQLLKDFDLKLNLIPCNWHQLDALVCWVSGLRKNQGLAVELGKVGEGVIVV